MIKDLLLNKLLVRLVFFFLVMESILYGYNPAILMEVNIDKNDTSYVGLGYKAIKSFENLYKKEVPIFSSEGRKLDKQELIKKVASQGYNPIISLGYLYSKPIQQVAQEFPNKTFIIIDGNAGKGKNILNLNFKEEEGAFLVGAIAAMKTKSNTIGFIGGMDIPVIRRFACGYIQGAKYVNPKINVLIEMTGTGYLAFNNPKKGKELANSMIKKGVDIIFHASDRTGKGVIAAAKDNKIFAIGVDSNQNGEAPGYVLTSMLKRIDIAIYKVLIDSMNNQLTTKDKRLGIKEEGVSWILDKNNITLINNKMHEEIDKIEFDVIQGIIEVKDYIEEKKCVHYTFDK